VSITDVCGRTTTTPFTIFSVPASPSAVATNNGCLYNSGKIVISILNYKVVTAIITVAPASYPFALPHDVSGTIDTASGTLTLDPVPIGDYTFVLTDDCNDLLTPLNVTVPIYVDHGLNSDERPGCDLQRSAVKVGSFNSALSTITITAAPATFLQTLPYNGNANIANDGNFYMNGFPPGSYTFDCKDVCGFSNTITVNVQGYTITSSTFSLQANCGSFDIPLNFVSNGTIYQAYWLQKLINATTNTWGNPTTNVVYPDGTVPNTSNSFPLNNNATNFNLTFNGTFRIVRSFKTYVNGSEFNSGSVAFLDKNCLEILSPTLSFNQVLEIVDANRMPCTSNGNLDVVLTANGTAPIHYTIIEKDGLPFAFDNGNSNVFLNLAPGNYIFQVQDSCGNIVNRPFDVASLLSLVTITKPQDILTCENAITGNETFDLTPQSTVILGTQPPTNFTISYHNSLLGAQTNTDTIANLTTFNPANNPQTVYVRVVYNPLPNCYETTSFDVLVGETPKLNLNPTYLSCGALPITLDASLGNLPTTTYLWSDGTTNPTITVSQLGINTLSVAATNSYGTNNQGCTNTSNITVTISDLPTFDHIETSDWTYNENTITVFTSNVGSFEYSLDGINYQDENMFTNLEAGVYTVYLHDKLGCGLVTKDVWLLYYPNFFTPNGDGYNDTWFIKNAAYEPDLKVCIYDRYGKLLAFLDTKNPAWNGEYNNHQAVSSDYWFSVTRQDGRILKGHFTLKR
jgi:gliding motility-associated-like protein